MFTLRVLVVLSLGVVLATSGGAAAAAGAPEAAPENKVAEALRRAYRIKPAPELLLQLGLLLQQDGQPLGARDHVRRALAELPPSFAGPQREQAEALLRTPAPDSAEVRLNGQRNAAVLLDDKLVGVLPLPLPLLVRPGAHRVRLELGSKHWQIDVTVPVFRTVDVHFAPDSNAAVVTTPQLVLLLPSVEREGEIPPALLRGIDRALRRAKLARAPIEGGAEAPLGGTGCAASLTCELQLGEQRGVDFVLTLRGQLLGDNPRVDFQLVDVAVADVALRGELACPGCDVPALAMQLAERLEPKLVEATTRARGEIYITSNPATAEVYRGSILLGATPLKRPAWPGALEISLRLARHEPQTVNLTVAENQTAKQTVNLKAVPVVVPVPIPRSAEPGQPLRPASLPRWRLGLGIGLVGAGVFTVGVGVAALSIDGHCAMDAAPPAQVCDGMFQTQSLGIGLTVSGALVVAGGVLLLTLPVRR